MKQEYPQEFEDLYQKYPRKKGKAPGYKTWQKLKKKEPETLKKIAHFVENHDFGKDIEFIPYFSSWINARGWEDELKPKRMGQVGRDIAYKQQQKEIEEKRKINPVTVEQMAAQIRKRPGYMQTEESLIREIKLMRKLHVPPVRKKWAQAICQVWGKEAYLNTYQKITSNLDKHD